MNAAERSQWFFRCSRVFVWSFLKIWHRFSCEGTANIPATGGVIIAANHASFLDPPAIGANVFHRIVRFMARDTLFKPGFPTWLLNRLAVMPISRGKGDLAALKKAIQILKDGGCLGLFPEGTRTLDGNLQPAKGGIGFLIAKAGVPVVPAYLEGTFEAYPKGGRFLRPLKVRLRFGPAILPEEIAKLGSDRDSYEKVAALVMERIAALRDEPKRSS